VINPFHPTVSTHEGIYIKTCLLDHRKSILAPEIYFNREMTVMTLANHLLPISTRYVNGRFDQFVQETRFDRKMAGKEMNKTY